MARMMGFDHVHAESIFISAVENAERWSDQPIYFAAALNNLAFLYRVQRKYDQAESIYRRSIAAWRSSRVPNGVNAAFVLHNLAVLYFLREDAREAENLGRQVLKIYETTFRMEHPEVARALNDISEFLRVQGKYADAEALCRDALTMREKAVGWESPAAAQSLNNLGLICDKQGKYDEAETCYQRSFAIFEKTLGDKNPHFARMLLNFSAFYRNREQYSEAERLLQVGLRILDRESAGSQELDLLPQLDQILAVYQGLSEYGEPDAPWPVPSLRERSVMATESAALAVYQSSVRLFKRSIQEDKKNKHRLMQTVKRLGPWYHNIQLTPDLCTNPERGDYPASRWRFLEPHVPLDLRGKTVLDIGCNAGFFSVELKRRGAARVVGIDIMPHVLAQARFVSSWFDQTIELRELSAYEVKRLGVFDIVFFIGVLYHLEHPLNALQQISAVCADTLYVQTALRGSMEDFEPANDYPESEQAIFQDPAYPKLCFIEKAFNGDVSNWWFPTRSCFKAMLRSTGFEAIQDTFSPDILVCRKSSQ